MGLFDRFKRKNKRGVRRELRPERAPHQSTREIPLDSPHPPMPPRPDSRSRLEPAPPRPSGAPAPPRKTEVRRVSSPQPSTHAVPTPRPHAEPVGYQGGGTGTDEKTVLTDIRGAFTTAVVGVLVAVDGEFEGEVYTLHDGENRIGRTKDCDVQLPSRHISRPHAMLIHRDGMFAIRPLASENPTFVNDKRIEDVTQVADRDHIRFGRTTVRLLSVA